MSYTMEDFERELIKDSFHKLSPEKRRELLESLPPEERLAGLHPEERLAGLSPEEIQQYLKKLSAGRSAGPRKPRRKT